MRYLGTDCITFFAPVTGELRNPHVTPNPQKNYGVVVSSLSARRVAPVETSLPIVAGNQSIALFGPLKFIKVLSPPLKLGKLRK